jgi:hypothetical protein
VGYSDDGKVLLEREINHNSKKQPYIVIFTIPSARITRIACCPVEDENIQSPYATVTAGGLNHKYVHILLKPATEAEWAYKLEISGEESPETGDSQQVRIE